MKTRVSIVRLSGAMAVLTVATALLHAGQGADYWRRAKPVTTFSEARSVRPEDTVTMQCNKCKTVLVRDSRHVGPPSKGHEEWFTVGSKHTCDECKGEITVVRGKTTDSMQHNCSKCGEGAVTCCVAPAAPAAK